jgi:pyruvate/2-oxoglutarate dehydrogenase complex dihydrolipoamide acyltransferase (E2) component
MARPSGYRVERISRARLALAAGQAMAHRRHLMFGLVEVDVTEPLRLIAEHRALCGERLSLSGYVTTCLARTLREFPELNAFRRGRSVVMLDEVIVVVLVERLIDGQSAVEYLPIRQADAKSLVEITREIRAEQASPPRVVPGQRWLERLPTSLTPFVMGWASRSIWWGLRFGTAGVNNIGFGRLSGWGLSPGAGTVAVTIGGVSPRQAADGTERQIAHLTLTFDHDVVDGAPAARFTSRLVERLESGETASTQR